ncbi:hypothetical protein BDV35DRAFT_390602 [Aspergillus flavus]|uniref:Uncharacterized protein n=1 Tax=Aspergillus flavus TaxID=5059 RepID=A0A5N6H3E2_ASPFL|nr:hypothetical protein BDV35DRAFT_390602 [Aspergillus flavus]
MLTPSTTPPKPLWPEPSYPANLYEWTPDGWRFFGFAPESPAGSVPPEWEGDGDDVTALCPPGYTLVAVQPCSVGYILVEEPDEMTEPGDPLKAARDATYVILSLLTVMLLSLAAQSYTRRSKKASRENSAMSLPVMDLSKSSASELAATEKTWDV